MKTRLPEDGMGTALVVWRKFPIQPRKPKKVTRTICEVIRELYRDAEERGDALSMQRLDEAHDMAKRMDRKLRDYSGREAWYAQIARGRT